jgi:hypothetical protein
LSFIPDFVNNPSYLSLFMIWASGYIFTYAVFRKSTAWKNFDIVMKVVVALVVGFTVEYGIIVPIFYLLTGGFAVFSLSTLNGTWLFQSCLVLFLSYVVYKNDRIPQFINQLFGNILRIFVIAIVTITGIGVGWFCFNDNIKATNPELPSFAFSIVWLLLIGALFCFVFPKLTNDAYSNLIRQKTLDDIFSKRTKTIRKNKKKQQLRFFYIGVIAVLVISALAAPIDQNFSVLTPKVSDIQETNWSDGSINLSLYINGLGSITPIINTNFSKTTQSYYTITPANAGGARSVIILPPPYLSERSFVITDYSSTPNNGDTVFVRAPYSNITVQKIKTQYSQNSLNVSYPDGTTHPINVTLSYWADYGAAGITIIPYPTICSKYNDTFYQWDYKLTITNNDKYYVKINDIELYQQILNDENGTAVSMAINGKPIYFDINYSQFLPKWESTIQIGKTYDIELRCLSQNSI